MGLLTKMFGTHSQREIKKIRPLVDKILALEGEYAALSEEALKGKTAQFKERLAKGETLDDILVEAFAAMDLSQKSAMMSRYRADCITLGREISLVRADDQPRHGRAVDIDEDGALVVEFAPGVRETVNSGEVSIRGLYGYV